MDYPPPAIPVVELEADFGDVVMCGSCNNQIEGDAYYDGDGNHYCEKCIGEICNRFKQKAKDLADKECKIIHALPKYDATLEYRCTPEEYETGDRESYTPNAYMCYCRHNCTNYDALIKNLARDRLEDQIYYSAIYDRIYELIEEYIEEHELDDEWEDEEE